MTDGRAVAAMSVFVREGGVFSPEAMLLHAQSRGGAQTEESGGEEDVVCVADDAKARTKAKAALRGGKNKANKHVNKAKQQHQHRAAGHDRRTQAQLRATSAPIILAHLPDVGSPARAQSCV
jgi:hypothetical protein